MEFYIVTFFKLTLGSDCLEICSWTIDFKNYPDSEILQKYHSHSSQNFKCKSAHMPSLNLVPNLFLNVCYTKGKDVLSLDSLWTVSLKDFDSHIISQLVMLRFLKRKGRLWGEGNNIRSTLRSVKSQQFVQSKYFELQYLQFELSSNNLISS